MEQHLFILLFYAVVIPAILTDPRKYYLIQNSKTWSDAQVYCHVHHTDMAIIQNNKDIDRLQNEIQTQQFSSSAWIGLYREINTWYWSLENEPLGSKVQWASEQPDNWATSEWCVVMRLDGWADVPCTSKYPMMCFDDTKTGDQRYIHISTSMTWYEAQAYCRNHYTDLASDRDATENSVILSLIPGLTWIGLSGESWKWINQTTYSTISWMSGQPDNTGGNAACGYLYNSQAADALCSDIMPFFCFSVITGLQNIVRMELRSNKDVNDPAVMDAIIEQIQQKLEEHDQAGNVTVKWRAQPDGKVFYKKKKEE